MRKNMTYNDLKKNIKRNKDKEYGESLNIAVLGDTATQFISTAIEGMGFEYGLRANVYDAEYDSINTEILDPSSGLFAEKRDYTVIYMSAEKLCEHYQDTPVSERRNFAVNTAARIEGYWKKLIDTGSRIIQFNFNKLDTGVFGNFALKEESSFEYQLIKANMLLSELAVKYKNAFIIDIDAIKSRLGEDAFCDRKFYFQARMSMSFEAIVEAVKQLYDIMLALKGRLRKCLILDLDNTLWGGVIGDDGLKGIEIGELGAGRAYTDLQRWCLELEKRGVLLAVCSKNDEDTAKEPFLKHPDMVLHLEDFAVFVANWEDKAANIRYIQKTLNIGMDSLVFVDDNPFERNLVKELIPEITVPELPEDASEYLSYLQSLHLFETVSFSEEDHKRTEQYRTEAQRKNAQEVFSNIDDYLKSLEMTAVAKPFDEFHFPRIAELSQRSNQFNLRTIRYSEEDIKRIAGSDGYLTLYFTLKDKFGDYGLVSAVIIEKRAENEGFIDTWFMSCRVLKRGCEEFIINSVVEEAKNAGIGRLTGQYIPTAKNKMVADIYEKMGFTPLQDGLFTLEVNTYTPHICHIERSLI
ncbi:MAG: HAD family hydrolase [Lachnospiraceae bacterium]|nr:HAD family hydrolase [Lachnospiraceae bacterium]